MNQPSTSTIASAEPIALVMLNVPELDSPVIEACATLVLAAKFTTLVLIEVDDGDTEKNPPLELPLVAIRL